MGFEPTPPKRLVPKTSALDRSAIQPVPAPAAAGRTGVRPGQNKKLAPAGNQTRVSSVAGTYTITVLPAHDNVSVPRLELGISRVLGERHNQLDHTDGGKTKNGVSGFRSQYLVLAKDARFRLRQYPAARLIGVSGFRSQYLVLAKHARFRLRQYPDGSRRRGGQQAAVQISGN